MSQVLFVTGRLAEPALRRTLAELAPRLGFECAVAVLPITVVALATTSWIARHLEPPPGTRRVILPGLCNGALDIFQRIWSAITVERGPEDLRDLPEFLGHQSAARAGYGDYDIAILAEINHAPRLRLPELLTQARKARADGADIIDLGCTPGEPWHDVAVAVAALRAEGIRVSLDTFDPLEAEQGAKAGAELILSVNQSNR